MKYILITGINGYIASHLADTISSQVDSIHGSVRKFTSKPNDVKITLFETGDLENVVDWNEALTNVDTVFHLAGTVHSAHEPKMYNRAITHATKMLVEQAIKHNVKHFVYVSSIAVYGKEKFNEVINKETPPSPKTPYGEAKLAAENELIRLAEQSSMTYTIVRPPIVYGKNAPGNVARLQKLIKKFPLLPFGCATEKRSLVSVDNLVQVLIECGTNPDARNQIFNVTDPEDMTTREFCQWCAKQLDKKIVLVPVPKILMRVLFLMAGQRSMYDKLFGRLRIRSCSYPVHATRQALTRPFGAPSPTGEGK